jgi:Ca-activated chloride channel family protein
MLAEDLQLGSSGLVESIEDYEAKKGKRLNRIDAVKNVAREFVKAESNNMIGIVAFAAYAYIICPPTFDQEWLLSSIGRIQVGMIKDATDIGASILAGVDALSTVKAKSRAIILLTDGNNNYGKIPPLVAAKTAKALGIKVYTIGIISKGQAIYPKMDERGCKTYEYVRIEIDEDMLRKIAQITGGVYYRVKNLDALKEGYDDIGRLEKTRMEERGREESEDMFSTFIAWAVFILLLDAVLSNTFLRRIP